MVGLASNFSDVFLMAKPELRKDDVVQCSKHYVACQAIFSRSSVFSEDWFAAGLTLIKHVVYVLVDYTPLIGRVCQSVREKYFGLNFTKIAREAAREAASKIDIRISCLDGVTFGIEVSKNDTVRELKESIANERGLHISCIELFSTNNGEEPLRSSDTLDHLGVIATPSIFMVLGSYNKAALETLYNSCGGLQWRMSAGWMTDPDISNWWGVTLNEDGRVTRLRLGSNRLAGMIPPEIGALTVLKELDLNNNGLTGSIPEAIGALTALQGLDLSRNQLSGAIPPQIGALTELKILDLSRNQLSGAIPPQIGALTELKILDLSYNQLSGPIPPQIGALTVLKELDLHTNNLSGAIPQALGRAQRFSRVWLWDNDFTGTVPAHLHSHLSAILYENSELEQ